MCHSGPSERGRGRYRGQHSAERTIDERAGAGSIRRAAVVDAGVGGRIRPGHSRTGRAHPRGRSPAVLPRGRRPGGEPSPGCPSPGCPARARRGSGRRRVRFWPGVGDPLARPAGRGGIPVDGRRRSPRPLPPPRPRRPQVTVAHPAADRRGRDRPRCRGGRRGHWGAPGQSGSGGEFLGVRRGLRDPGRGRQGRKRPADPGRSGGEGGVTQRRAHQRDDARPAGHRIGHHPATRRLHPDQQPRRLRRGERGQHQGHLRRRQDPGGRHRRARPVLGPRRDQGFRGDRPHRGAAG